ncbi:MAG: hypothetical protein ABFD60_06310 [Bryobacteraceae bacterium]
MRNALRILIPCVLVLAGCRGRMPDRVRIDPSLEKLVPQDATMLAGARVEELLATPAYQRWGAKALPMPMDRFARETGFDPRKDIKEILTASDGKNSVFLARGRFPLEKFGKSLNDPGIRRWTHRGRTLIGNDLRAAAVLDSNTAAAGPATAVQSAIDRADSGGGGIPGYLAERMKAIPRDSQLWIVTLGLTPVAKEIPEQGNLSNLRRILASVESASVGIDLRNGFRMDVRCICRTDDGAKLIHDSLRGFVGMGRLTAPEGEPELLKFYDSIEISQNQRTVIVHTDMPMARFEKFVEKSLPGSRGAK